MRALIACLIMMLTLAPARGQPDPRTAAHATIASVLRSDIRVALTQYGFSTVILAQATGQQCDSYVAFYERPADVKDRPQNPLKFDQVLRWNDVERVERSRLVSRYGNNENAVKVTFHDNPPAFFGLSSDAAARRLQDAMETLWAACAPATPRAQKPDPRPMAHSTIRTLLNGHVEGADTSYGWVPDLISHSIRSSSGCRTVNVTTFRRVEGPNRRYLEPLSKVEDIDWANISLVSSSLISGTYPNPNGAKAIAMDGTRYMYGLKNPDDARKLWNAMETLRVACRPGEPWSATPRAPAPPPPLRTMPAPAPVSRPIPQTPSPADPVAQPATGFYWSPQKDLCHSNAVQNLRLWPNGQAHIMRVARYSNGKDYMSLLLFSPSLAQRPENEISVQSTTGPGHARSASLSFDGRPAGIPLQMVEARYSNPDKRTIGLPRDFLDRLATVSVMTLSLKNADGAVVNGFSFDVADIRHARRELTAANWRCDGAS
ncbi:MAG: hypothetical protein EOP59_02890 [Sphingomonadales bacterium]|nr:MAG: hypothetical protein EOP59_02890 [Sphingomonadales bacterium]